MFEILDHTADIGLRACGSSVAEMAGQASLGLVSLVMDTGAIEPRSVYPLAVTGDDPESLLVNWLSEVLYYLDGERVALGRFEVKTWAAGRASGLAWGEPRDPVRHAPKLVVKGVTYHQLRIFEDKGRWCAEVFFDI